MAMKEDRAREGKKAKYRKMGFGNMMDSGEINFGDKHPLTKKRLKNFKKKKTLWLRKDLMQLLEIVQKKQD